MSRLPCLSVRALLEFLRARVAQDATEAGCGGEIDHVLLDGCRIVETLAARLEAAHARGELNPQLLRRLQVRAMVYADHPDFRDEWRPYEAGASVEPLNQRRLHPRHRRKGSATYTAPARRCASSTTPPDLVHSVRVGGCGSRFKSLISTVEGRGWE